MTGQSEQCFFIKRHRLIRTGQSDECLFIKEETYTSQDWPIRAVLLYKETQTSQDWPITIETSWSRVSNQHLIFFRRGCRVSWWTQTLFLDHKTMCKDIHGMVDTPDIRVYAETRRRLHAARLHAILPLYHYIRWKYKENINNLAFLFHTELITYTSINVMATSNWN